MENRHFFRTRLGHAAIASVTAMVIFVVLSSQISPSAALAAAPYLELVTPA